MFDKEKYPIRSDWQSYYEALENIRSSGSVNMWGASPVLAKCMDISQELANDVLLSWITNYDELKIKYNW